MTTPHRRQAAINAINTRSDIHRCTDEPSEGPGRLAELSAGVAHRTIRNLTHCSVPGQDGPRSSTEANLAAHCAVSISSRIGDDPLLLRRGPLQREGVSQDRARLCKVGMNRNQTQSAGVIDAVHLQCSPSRELGGA